MRITALLLSFMLAVMRPAVQPLLHVAMLGFSLFVSFPDLAALLYPFVATCKVCKKSLARVVSLARWRQVTLSAEEELCKVTG